MRMADFHFVECLSYGLLSMHSIKLWKNQSKSQTDGGESVLFHTVYLRLGVQHQATQNLLQYNDVEDRKARSTHNSTIYNQPCITALFAAMYQEGVKVVRGDTVDQSVNTYTLSSRRRPLHKASAISLFYSMVLAGNI